MESRFDYFLKSAKGLKDATFGCFQLIEWASATATDAGAPDFEASTEGATALQATFIAGSLMIVGATVFLFIRLFR